MAQRLRRISLQGHLLSVSALNLFTTLIVKALYKYLEFRSKLVHILDAVCLCVRGCKETKEVEQKIWHCMKLGFLLGSLVVFLDTSPSFLCEALFLVKNPNADCRL